MFYFMTVNFELKLVKPDDLKGKEIDLSPLGINKKLSI